jgi:transposase InsO family protein
LGGHFIYLAVILDAYTRAVRGWHLSTSLSSQDLTVPALEKALTQATPFMFHSDQGSQYAAWNHLELLLERGVQISMAEQGQATQNGLAERFIRTLKEEHVDYSEYEDFLDTYQQLTHWIEVEYMTERVHSALGYLTPAEFEVAALAQTRYPLLSDL